MSFGTQRKCKHCKTKFKPINSFMAYCLQNDECIAESNKQFKAKKSRELKKEFKENDKGTLLRIAQMTFNKYIRLRDRNDKCISCDYVWNGIGHQRQQHSSHYISTSKSRLLRFNEDNAHKSCQICNTHLSGNLAEYRPRLIEKIGLDRVLELERLANDSEPCRYTVEDYKNIIEKYKNKIKEILS